MEPKRTVPFADQNVAAVCARVALAIVRREYRLHKGEDIQPVQLIAHCQFRIPPRMHVLCLAMLALKRAVQAGMSTRQWLTEVRQRDLHGLTWRECFDTSYKANRRA